MAFLYGQRHSFELTRATETARMLGAKELKVVAIGLSAIVKTALTGQGEVPDAVESKDIPATWVPQRNSIFLAMAWSYAETVGADLIYAGMNCQDYSGYPDCRPEFLQSMEKALNWASKRYTVEGKGFGLSTPLLRMKKTEIIQTGLGLGVDYSRTWSCYKGPNIKVEACGVCDSCSIRLKAFRDIQRADPLKYDEPGICSKCTSKSDCLLPYSKIECKLEKEGKDV
jgi:7-cyano-7-deazaguanine synthase